MTPLIRNKLEELTGAELIKRITCIQYKTLVLDVT